MKRLLTATTATSNIELVSKGRPIPEATTTTDENGRYAVCQLPDFGFGQRIDALKSGFVTDGHTVSISGTMEFQLDIELKR